MSQLHQGVAAALAAELERRGSHWDEEPALYAVQLSADHEHLRIGQFPFTPDLWAGASPVEVLQIIATALLQLPPGARPLPPGGETYAVAFRVEAWGIPDSEPGTAQASEDANDALRHRLKNRPDRIELRSMSAVDISGASYQIEQARGEELAVCRIGYPPGEEQPDDPKHCGAVFEELDRILFALTGAQPPARPRA